MGPNVETLWGRSLPGSEIFDVLPWWNLCGLWEMSAYVCEGKKLYSVDIWGSRNTLRILKNKCNNISVGLENYLKYKYLYLLYIII